jgi:hypothetical protein
MAAVATVENDDPDPGANGIASRDHPTDDWTRVTLSGRRDQAERILACLYRAARNRSRSRSPLTQDTRE